MSKILFKNAKIVTDKEIIESNLLVNEDIIEKIEKDIKEEESYEIIDVNGNYLIPAFVDVHIHGASGHDFMDSTDTAVKEISKFLCTKGTSNFLSTTLSSKKSTLIENLKIMSKLQNEDIGGATLVGVHMEGPYFDVEYKGAQNDKYIIESSIKDIDEFLSVKDDLIKIFSISPHSYVNREAIKYLTSKGIITSVGHSNATYEEVEEAIALGLSHSTHTYNGMRGFTHREPGVVGAVFNNDSVYAEVIFDNVHVHKEAVRILIKIKGVEKVICITDSMAATGLQDGKYKLGELDINVADGQARLESNGALAGSVLTLDKAFKNLINLGYSIVDAVKMTSTNAATELKLNTGKISEGRYADIVIMNKDYEVISTYVKGKLKYKKSI